MGDPSNEDEYRNVLQIEPSRDGNLDLIVQGSWGQNLRKIDDFRRRLGEEGIATAAAVTKETGQPGFTTPGAYGVKIVLDKETLRQGGQFGAVHALLDGVTKDLNIRGDDGQLSRASIYERVEAVTGLKEDEYQAAFGKSKNEIQSEIKVAKNPPSGVLIFAGHGFVLPSTEPVPLKNRPTATPVDYATLRQQSIDSDVEIVHAGKDVFVTIGFGLGETGFSANESANRSLAHFKAVAGSKGLLLLGQNELKPPSRLSNAGVLKLETTKQAETLAELLPSIKSVSVEKLDEIKHAVPKGFWSQKMDALSQVFARPEVSRGTGQFPKPKFG